MKIDGRQIADNIFDDLKERVGELQKNNIIPKLAVILVGENPSSEVYVLQKQLRGKEINVEIEILRFPETVSGETLIDKIRELNLNSQIHGIIVQRPLPAHINPDTIENEIADSKDVDGFKPGSPFHVPLVLAVVKILEEAFTSLQANEMSEAISGIAASPSAPRNDEFTYWLKSKKIVLLGKGSTAGKPLLDYFKEIGANFQLVDSKTENPQEITKQADIIISSVGKESTIKPEMLKSGVILIGVGINKNEEGKLHGDYDEDQIKDIASLYTPTPGGVGPVNVAMLLQNLLTAAEESNHLQTL